MNKDKIIKDLKERNDKLANQYRLRDIRCYYLEHLVKIQEDEIKVLNNNRQYLNNLLENKDRWCQLIVDIGYDYDGYRKAESLMILIDELVNYALHSKNNDDYFEILGGK